MHASRRLLLAGLALLVGCDGCPSVSRHAAPDAGRRARAVDAGTESRRSETIQLEPGRLPPEYAWWVGANDHEAVLRLGGWSGGDDYYALVDLDRGCITQTLVELDAVWAQLGGSSVLTSDQMAAPDPPPTAASADDFSRQWYTLSAWMSRVGATTLPGDHDLDTADGGRRLLLDGDDMVLLSEDGGRHFATLGARPSYGPWFSPDGSLAAFRSRVHGWRGYRIVVARTRPIGPRRPVGGRLDEDPLEMYFDDDGRSLLVAYRSERRRTACVDRIDVATGRARSLACFPSDTGWMGIVAVSPHRRYGTLEVSDDVARSRETLLLDLATGTLVARAHPDAMDPPVDDQGRLAWSANDQAFLTTARGTVPIGPGVPLGWDARGRLLIIDDRQLRANMDANQHGQRSTTIPACSLVRTVVVPR